MQQVRNETPFIPRMFMFPDERGVDMPYVVVKETFTLLGHTLTLAE